jgi:mannose-6-phosphate isomerase-like protein (cupin superfamily)
MQVRRVVTGHSDAGKAVVASDRMIDANQAALFPGFSVNTLWASDAPAAVPVADTTRPRPAFFPRGEGVRFIRFTLPPRGTTPPRDEVMPAALAEVEAVFPGLMATMDPALPGMHRSDTVDFLYIASGSVDLRLEDGHVVSLTPGDTVVQTGTWHRWENRGTEPCHIVAVLVAATRTDRG